MVLVNNYYVFDKHCNDDFNTNSFFSSAEMECHCSFPECKEQLICKDLIDKLDKLRLEYSHPIMVTSGYRCQKYQDALAASGKETAKGISQHTLGNAADIRPKDINDMSKVAKIAENYFASIGIANSFTHLDLRPTKRLWTYKKS